MKQTGASLHQEYICKWCGTTFESRPRKGEDGKYYPRKCCSRSCAGKQRMKEYGHPLKGKSRPQHVVDALQAGKQKWIDEHPEEYALQRRKIAEGVAKWKTEHPEEARAALAKAHQVHSENAAKKRIHKICAWKPCSKSFNVYESLKDQQYCSKDCADKALIKWHTEEEKAAARKKAADKTRARSEYKEREKVYRANPQVKARHAIAARKHEKKTYATPAGRMRKLLAHRIRMGVKYGRKNASTIELLGCSIEYFKKYFYSRFTGDMTITAFMNGQIHIDHIKACARFSDLTDPIQQKECFHYTNLQPLWAKENMEKGAKKERRKITK